MAGAKWVKKGREPLPGRHIQNDEILSQYGMKGSEGNEFRGQPRFDDTGEQELSMLVGKMSRKDAHDYVAGHRALSNRDSVRYFRVGDLRDRGYVITHTPTQQNPYHISVAAPADCDPRTWWTSEGEPILEILRLSDEKNQGEEVER